MRSRMPRMLAGLALAGLSVWASAAPPPNSAVEQARIERLAGLGRVWGMVRYLHPALATRPVDWDRALVEAIPRVDAAQSQAAYVAALNGMLAVLDDPATQARLAGAEGDRNVPPSTAKTKAGEPTWLDADRVMHIDVPLAANLLAAGDNALRGALVARSQELDAQAKAVVIDLRRPDRADEYARYMENDFLSAALPSLLDRPVALPTSRYRVHNGYAPQDGSSSGGYYSALVTETPALLPGQRKGKALPIVFLVNAFANSTGQVRGLRSAGRAWVVQEGTAPQANATRTLRSIPGIELDLSIAEQVAADGSTAFVADVVVPPGKTADAIQQALDQSFPRNVPAQSLRAALPASELDRRYAEMAFPSKEYRLLALFRYWNAIEYFYPYKDLIGGDWNAVLARYIPRFEADADAMTYQRTLTELSTEIHDSHSGVGGATALSQSLGQYVPPLRLRLVEGQTVVAQVLAPSLPVKAGDVLVAVDGMPVERLRDEMATLVPASTPQALQRNLHMRLLRGPKDSPATLRLRGIDGALREIVVKRDLDRASLPYNIKRNGPVVDVLAGGIGYVDLDRLQNSEVDAMFARLRDAPAIVFDMRGYPNGTAWSIAPRLGTKQKPVGAQFFRPIVEASGLGGDTGGWPHYQFDQVLPEAKGERYAGKVVMLVDEYAQSQAEHTGLFFEAATPTTFIGSPTAGANGDVTTLVVPGGMTMSFSGHSVRHADGRQLQRLGLQPDIRVEPTIAGIAAGRDEVLEAALKFLQGSK